MRIRFVTATVTCLLFLLSVAALSGQTLSERLIKEDPANLVVASREGGNIVRGAILFHQGNIACAKCHRPVNENQRIGPNLSLLKAEVTDKSIVESILLPSKSIEEEYLSYKIATDDGKIHVGIIASQNDAEVVLRDQQDVNRMIRIPREEIEEMAPSKISIMPAGLADELKNRQQFLDLLRYVLDLKDRGPEANIAQHSAQEKRELTPQQHGRVLLKTLNCKQCHADKDTGNSIVESSAPDLKWSAKHLNPRHLIKFIADPHAIKPGSTMPQTMTALDAKSRTEIAESIVHYLTSAANNDFHQTTTDPVDAAAIKNGHELFHSVGCVACHAPRNEQAQELALKGSQPLGDLKPKYSLSALTQFLENPHSSRPRGRMPNMALRHKEAVNISAFLLLGNSSTGQTAAWTSNAELAAKGKTHFESLQCNRCHQDISKPTDDTTTIPQLAALDPQQGCLAETANQRVEKNDKLSPPRFSISETDREHLRAALADKGTQLSSEERIEIELAHYNCLACHQRNGLGGVASDRKIHFQTIDFNLGEQGRIPPSLTGVGAKLKSKWMRDVLVNGRSARPYMKTRMPQYGEQNVGQLVDWFQSTDELPAIEFNEVEDHKVVRKQGHALVGNKGLNCAACHTYQYKGADTMPAVDLTEMSDRLTKRWFYHYMMSPQRFVPNTVMPSFWPNGKAIRNDLSGTAQQQVEAIWEYLLDGRQARAPRGVIREPLEIVVSEEARMLRRAYPEMDNKRGIGVGYPGGVNIAFDAEQLRLTTIWKGKFVDPSPVWYGQGSGRVKALGKTISLPKGPELDDAQSPWVVDEGRPPNHQFKGYTLDAKRRPTFRYSLGSVTVEDFFSEQRGADPADTSLKRTLKFTASGHSELLRFRLLKGDKVQMNEAGKQVTLGPLTIQILSDHQATTSLAGDKQAAILLDFKQGDTQELQLEYRWK